LPHSEINAFAATVRTTSTVAGYGAGGTGQQRFGVGELTDGHVAAATLVGDLDAEPVQRRLCLGHRADASGAPPRLGEVVDRLLDDAFAVAVPWRTRINPDAVMLRHRHEAALHLVRARADDRGHAVDPPPSRRTTQAGQDLVQPDDEVGLVVGLGEPASHPIRVRQRTDEDVRLRMPRGVVELEPVPLDLLAGGMLDVDVGSSVAR
jgi:hypothetical protein